MRDHEVGMNEGIGNENGMSFVFVVKSFKFII